MDELKSKIITEFPSLCWTCDHARKPASNENRDKGYVGCAQACRKESYSFISTVEEIATTWVDLRSRPFSDKGSGIITNNQIVTLGVEECQYYYEKK